MRAPIFAILFLLINCFIQAQIYTPKDVEIFKNIIETAKIDSLQKESIGKVIVEIGKHFIGTDYVAYSLEVGEKESLVVNLRKFDCTTFLDNSLVFARLIKKENTSFADYINELTNERYRYGKLNKYPSRLHYFTDWLYDAEKRGLIKNITEQIGGVPYNKKIDFMSKNKKYYKQLSNKNYFKEIIRIEKEINKRKYYYIPKEKISKIECKIRTGDLIAITTSIKGLDISHVGIAIKMDDGRIHYLHAPNIGQKVKISKKTLADYLMGNKTQTGIMVARALEPK